MKLNSFLPLISTLVLLLTLTQLASAIELRMVIKEELIESQYGIIGDFFGVGDRLYRVTYEGGAQERVWKKSGSLLSGATIISTPSGMTTLEGQAATYYFVAQAPDLTRFTGGTGFAEHRFMMYDDTTADSALVSDIIDLQVPVATTKEIMFGVPATLPAGKRFFFMKEYVKDKTTGEWVTGIDSQASEWRFEVYVMPVFSVPAPVMTIRVDTIPTSSTITYFDSVIGVTAKDFPLQAGQTKILVLSKEGYVSVMKGISSSTVTPFIISLTKVSTSIPALPCPEVSPPLCPDGKLVSQPLVSGCPVPPTCVLNNITSTPISADGDVVPTSQTPPSAAGSANSVGEGTSIPTKSSVSGVIKELTSDSITPPPESRTGNKTIYNIGLVGIIGTTILIISYLAYTNLYVHKGTGKGKGKGKKPEVNSKKNGGKMWYE